MLASVVFGQSRPFRGARIYAFLQTDEFDSKRTKFFESIDELARAASRTVIAIDHNVYTSLTAR